MGGWRGETTMATLLTRLLRMRLYAEMQNKAEAWEFGRFVIIFQSEHVPIN